MTSVLQVAIVLMLVCLATYLKRRKRVPLPPGPSGWPLLGNAFDIPKEKAWLSYTEWKNIYGDVIYLSTFGRSIVILNSAKAAFDLLHKRSSIYSDRPRLVMGGELVGWKRALVLTPYGDFFRQRRRLLHQTMGPRPAQAFWPALEQQTVRFLGHLLDTPDQLVGNIRRAVASTALKISHGYTISETGQDHFVSLAETALGQFSLSTASGAFLVDSIPWLRYVPSWFPGAGFKRIAAAWRKDLFHMADTAHQMAKDKIGNGTAVHNFTSEHLKGAYTPETEFLVKWTAISIYGGATDTTVAAVSTFFLAMCTHPQIQTTAQVELATVVGSERLPNMADRPSLPYVDAIVKEVLRWGPVTPNGLPHRLTEDDVYEGRRIPAGSVILPNIWAMTHDPETFPKPHEFDPERFLGPKKIEKPFGDPLQLIFGFGRRVCPGQYLAEPSLFLIAAMTLATFTILKARDEHGQVIEPIVDWLPGTISHPRPFRCEIKPRSTEAINLIKQGVWESRA